MAACEECGFDGEAMQAAIDSLTAQVEDLEKQRDDDHDTVESVMRDLSDTEDRLSDLRSALKEVL